MYYLQFKNQKYENQQIVSQLCNDPPIDPEETKKKIEPIIKQTEEYKKQRKLAIEKRKLIGIQIQLIKEYYKSRDDKINKKYTKISKDLNILEKQLVEHNKLLNQKILDFRIQNAVYSTPKNAILIKDEDIEDWKNLLNKLESGDILLKNKKIIKAEQLEQERIDELSKEEKEEEKASKIQYILNEAIQLRNRLEIQKNKNALKESQEWFEIEKSKIEKKYE